jgi:hypothetical protein
MFLVFGLNGFLQFLPAPPHSGTAAMYLGGLAASGYFFPLLKGVEVLVGLTLLSGRFVALSLLVLAPIVLNIVLFHAFLAPQGTLIGLVALALGLYLAYRERAAYAPLFRSRSSVELETCAHHDKAAYTA